MTIDEIILTYPIKDPSHYPIEAIIISLDEMMLHHHHLQREPKDTSMFQISCHPQIVCKGVGHVSEHTWIPDDRHTEKRIYETEVQRLKEEYPVTLQLRITRMLHHNHTAKYIMDKFDESPI